MTREEKIYEINKLNSENKKILRVIKGFDKNNPDNMYIEVRKPDYKYNSYDSVRIKDEILITVVEMLKNKIDENNKRLDELLGVEE